MYISAGNAQIMKTVALRPVFMFSAVSASLLNASFNLTILASRDFCRLLITFANNLDPELGANRSL